MCYPTGFERTIICLSTETVECQAADSFEKSAVARDRSVTWFLPCMRV